MLKSWWACLFTFNYKLFIVYKCISMVVKPKNKKKKEEDKIEKREIKKK